MRQSALPEEPLEGHTADALGTIWRRLTKPLCASIVELRRDSNRLSVTHKPDGSILTSADLELQALIVEFIREFDQGATIIAEEGTNSRTPDLSGLVWVIDPIDGTRQFLSRSGIEFCTSIAVLSDCVPVACLIVAPELARGRGPLVIAVDGPGRWPTVNGKSALSASRTRVETRQCISATRPRSAGPQAFEAALRANGSHVKTRATSLTLDVARCCLDLTTFTDLTSFAWFYRRDQQLWDAAPGLGLAIASRMAAVDGNGAPVSPLSADTMSRRPPALKEMIVTDPQNVRSVLRTIGESRPVL
jgi:3'-phosphoadenosine 5'-phosphosulfate (PAPS) 3'-phosphatase